MFSYQQQKKRSLIGSMLVKKGLINPNQLDYAIRIQSESDAPLGQILVDKAFISDAELHSALSQQSIFRIVAMAIAFTFAPFQLSNASPSHLQKPTTELNSKLHSAMTEDIEGVESVYKDEQLSDVISRHSNLDNQLNLLWARYDNVLKRYIGKQYKQRLDANMVDYNKLRLDPELKSLVADLSKFPVSELNDDQQKISFYLNAYNILTLNMVSENWPLKKLSSLGGVFEPVWDKHAGTIDGKPVTLGEIEHEILRTFGDPRIHFAMSCASMSCPDLRDEAFRAEILDRQLDDQVMSFLAQDYKGSHLKGQTLQVSKIFKWFAADFHPQGGVDAFVRHYRGDLPEDLIIEPTLSYNWSINHHTNTIRADGLHNQE